VPTTPVDVHVRLRTKQFLPSSPSCDDLEFFGAQTSHDYVDHNACVVYTDLLKQGDTITKLMSKVSQSALDTETDSAQTLLVTCTLMIRCVCCFVLAREVEIVD
jgi:hypothetical protein